VTGFSKFIKNENPGSIEKSQYEEDAEVT